MAVRAARPPAAAAFTPTRALALARPATCRYLAGHNDVLAGAIAGKAEPVAAVRAMHNVLGGTVDPHAAYLLLRGMKTLGLRVEKQNATALELAKRRGRVAGRWVGRWAGRRLGGMVGRVGGRAGPPRRLVWSLAPPTRPTPVPPTCPPSRLEAHPRVSRVHYPGLPSHPDHAIARAQMRGFGGVISFEVDSDLWGAAAVVDGVRLPYIAPSLGGVESLIEQPTVISYWDQGADARAKVGIRDNLIRYSAGVEDVEDLWADLEQALARVPAAQ